MTVLRLKGRATQEYSESCRMLSVTMMKSVIGHPMDQVIGAVVVTVAAILMKYGEGVGDVDAFAESVRDAIKSHQRKTT